MDLKRNELMKNFGISILALLILLIIFELFFGFLAINQEKQPAGVPAPLCMFKDDEQLDYVLERSFETKHVTRTFNYYAKTNSLGVRENEEISVEGNLGVKRVFVLGDSFAFGYGVDQNKTIPFLLEQKINNSGSYGKVEVLNLGVPGYDIHKYALFFEKLSYLKPEIVLIFINGTDLKLEKSSDCFGVVYNCLVPIGNCEVDKEDSILDKFFGGFNSYTFLKEKFTVLGQQSGIHDIKIALTELIGAIRAQKVKPVIVLIPLPEIISNKNFSQQNYGVFYEVAKENSVTLIDLSDAVLKDNYREKLFYDFLDNHPTEYGGELFAEEISQNWQKVLEAQ